MYQALYRKYRPAVFDDVCGQEHITSVLKYETETDRVSHAYLFCGSRGTGKTTCAKILAKAVNCENPKGGNPCCMCDSCRAIDAGSAPDVLEMDAASNNGVDYIRDIRDAVAYTPAMLKKRVYIIDEVHMLSGSAFNALLKTLEEPPEHVVFILATTELHKLPSTIISRCQRFDFRRIPQSVLCARLQYIADTEGILLEDAAAQRIARQAQGGMRDAISLFELCGGGGSDVTLTRVDEILGLSGYEQLSTAASALIQGDMKTMFAIIADAAASSKDIAVFWGELTAFYRDLMVVKYCEDPKEYLDLTEQECQILTSAAAPVHIRTLIYHSKVLDEAMLAMNRMPQMKRTIAEFACLRMCEPQLDTSPEALSARIGQLEDKIAMLEVGGVTLSAPVKLEDTTATPDVAIPVAEVAPPIAPSASWESVEDGGELMEKLGEIDMQTRSILGDARILYSPDRTRAVIRVTNEFASRMLSAKRALDSVARAMLLCRICSSAPEITVEVVRAGAETDPAADELYRNLL